MLLDRAVLRPHVALERILLPEVLAEPHRAELDDLLAHPLTDLAMLAIHRIHLEIDHHMLHTVPLRFPYPYCNCYFTAKNHALQ